MDADYLLAQKDNQAVTEEEVRCSFNEFTVHRHAEASERVDYYEPVDADHGRVETRRHSITDQTGWFAENLTALRRLALNLLKSDNTQRISLRRKRLMAGWNRDYLQRVFRIR